MSREVLLCLSLQMVAPTYSSYYSQGIYSENLFPHFPLHPWEAISNSSPYYSFIHRPSSYKTDNQQGLTRRCWRNCCQRLRARRRRRQPPLRYPRWIDSMRFVIPITPNSLLAFPVLDLYSCCACVPSIVCRIPRNVFGWHDRSGLGELQFMEF
jgi:hypothetical protein